MKHGSENVFIDSCVSLMGTEKNIYFLSSAPKALVGKAGFLTTGGFVLGTIVGKIASLFFVKKII